MRFTKADIEEIARRLAIITKRDSELPDAEIPLDETERVPIIQYIPLVQDYENRLLSLADLRSLVLADHDQTMIACVLNVVCDTEDAVVRIHGGRTNQYIAYYGEIVDVVITADGYDAWFGAVTMTQDHTIYVSLNKTGGGGGTTVTTYYVKITNAQGATITINGSPVSSGSVNFFTEGTHVSALVSKEGYNPWSWETGAISSDKEETVSLVELTPEEKGTPYLRFDQDTISIQSAGLPNKVRILSNIGWELSGQASPVPDGTQADYDAVELPESILVQVGQEVNIIDNDMPLKFVSKNPSVARVDGKKVYGQSVGNTGLESYDENDTYLGPIPTDIQQNVEGPTGITLNKTAVEIGTSYNQSVQVRATVTPSTANQGVTWSSADKSVATVSASGRINSTRKGGETTVTATTVDGRLSASCKVVVRKEGIAVLSVTPDSVTVSEAGDTVPFSYTKKIYGGLDESVSVFCSGEYISAVDKTGDSFKIIFPRNYGTQKTYSIEVGGTGNDEPPKVITATQGGSTVVKEIMRYEYSKCHADGTFYLDGTHNSGLSSIEFVCATGYGETAVANASVSETWLTLNRVTLDTGYSFRDGTSAYIVSMTAAVNTGAARSATVTFPGNVVYTVYQDAAL